MTTPRTPKPPLVAYVTIPDGAPLSEEEWTPEQQAEACRALGMLLGLTTEPVERTAPPSLPPVRAIDTRRAS